MLKGELIARDFGYGEGPVCLPDGRLLFCDCNRGELCVLTGGQVGLYARTGGSPAAAQLGSDGVIYVTQFGNVPGSGDTSAIPSIQRVTERGVAETLFSVVAGVPLAAPNDLTFGPDGRLYFTDTGTDCENAVQDPAPGRLFVASRGGTGELLLERPRSYLNGIAFDARGRLCWTETLTRRLCRMEGGTPIVVCTLPENHLPDGLAAAEDGRMFVCTLSSGGVSVVSPGGVLLDHLLLGEWPTNCTFDGATLYVTCTRHIELNAARADGTVWRVETDARGIALPRGAL